MIFIPLLRKHGPSASHGAPSTDLVGPIIVMQRPCRHFFTFAVKDLPRMFWLVGVIHQSLKASPSLAARRRLLRAFQVTIHSAHGSEFAVQNICSVATILHGNAPIIAPQPHRTPDLHALMSSKHHLETLSSLRPLMMAIVSTNL